MTISKAVIRQVTAILTQSGRYEFSCPDESRAEAVSWIHAMGAEVPRKTLPRAVHAWLQCGIRRANLAQDLLDEGVNPKDDLWKARLTRSYNKDIPWGEALSRGLTTVSEFLGSYEAGGTEEPADVMVAPLESAVFEFLGGSEPWGPSSSTGSTSETRREGRPARSESSGQDGRPAEPA